MTELRITRSTVNRSDYVEAMRSLARTLDHAAAGAGVRADETIHDARRRNFDRAAAEARARDARR